jgi:intracellular septation protein A
MAITFINSVNNYCKFKNLAIVSFVHFQMVLVFGDICTVTGGAHEEALPAEESLVL